MKVLVVMVAVHLVVVEHREVGIVVQVAAAVPIPVHQVLIAEVAAGVTNNKPQPKIISIENHKVTIPMINQLTTNSQELITEIISRLEIRKKMCFKGENLNPYYIKGQYPTEYQDILAKIKELDKLKLKS